MNSRRILCIGKDSGVLRSRCNLLQAAGFVAEGILFLEAGVRLQRDHFDLIVLSAILQDEEQKEIKTLVGANTPVLVVPKTILASTLLAEIDQQLSPKNF